MSETTTDDKPVDYVEDCAVHLSSIAESLERIADILESCRSQLTSHSVYSDDRYAFRTIPLTD